MDYNIIEIDGVQITSDGRVPVDAIFNSTGPVVKVASPIFITHHAYDAAEVEQEIDNNDDYLFKTYNLPNTYLRSIFAAFNRKDLIISMWFDDVKLSELDIETQYEHYKHKEHWYWDVAYPSFGVYKEHGNYVVYFTYENTPINNNIKIKVRMNHDHSHSVKIKNVDYIYNTLP